MRAGRPKNRAAREMIALYVQAGRHTGQSYRAIAAQLGGMVCYETVRQIMREQHPEVHTEMGRRFR